MASSDGDRIIFNRLLVLLQLVLIPTYFVLFSLRWRDNLTVFFDNLVQNSIMSKILPDWLVWFEINLGIPIFFSFPWVVFTIFSATRIADSYELMGRALGKVRIDQKIFYGLNAAFTLIFLIFPFLSPLITIIGIFWAVRLVMRKLIIGRFLRSTWLLPALILSFVPGLIAYAFYSNYLVLFDEIFGLWVDAIPTLFGIGLSLAIGIAIGNFLLFLFEGRKYYGTGEEVPEGFVLIFKTFLFTILLTVFLASEGVDIPPVINYINYLAAFLGGFEFIARKFRDLPGSGSGSGIIMVLAFSFINIVINLLRGGQFVTWIQGIVIILSALIFFGLFALSYSYAPEEFAYPDDEPVEVKKDKEVSSSDETE